MGQLEGSGAVFLSAGVPDPSADHFLGEGDSAAITAAVSALLYVTLGRRRLVWGGHPAITPMVWSVAEAMRVNYSEWVTLYQSLVFKDEFPEETAKFQNVVFVKSVGDDVGESLTMMRKRMVEDTNFEAAVFVGGMAGVMSEYELICASENSINMIPIGSTGGAASVLNKDIIQDPILENELDYVSLLFERLGIDPNESRYARPGDQPKVISERIVVPSKSR